MSRVSIKKTTYQRLFALSGNQCAFPNCTHCLIDAKGNYLGQQCHIEAAEKGGERYNPNMSDEERASFDNLILFCYDHHVETNNVEEFPVKRLKEIKLAHEKHFSNNPYDIPPLILDKLYEKEQRFFYEISELNKKHSIDSDLAMEINTEQSLLELWNDYKLLKDNYSNIINQMNLFIENIDTSILSFLKKIGYDTASYEAIPYYENPFSIPLWAERTLGLHNIEEKKDITFLLLMFKYLNILQKQPDFPEDLYEEIKQQLKEKAKNSIYFD